MKTAADNKWYNLVTGLIIGITGQEKDIAKLNECLPEEMKILEEKAVIEKPAEKKTKIDTALGILKDVVKFICNFKDNIKKLFTRKLKKLSVMKKKVFLQRYGRRNFFDDIVDGVKKVGEYISKKWDDVKDWGTKLAKDLAVLWTEIKDLFNKFLNSDFVKLITKIYDCATKLKKTGDEIFKVIKGIIEKVNRMITQGWVGVATVFIDLVCNFEQFGIAIGHLTKAFSEPKVPLKFGGYGKCAGAFLRAVGTKKVYYFKKN
jgi:hypothetical protein